MRTINLILLSLFLVVLLYAVTWLPSRGDAGAPMHRERSPAGTEVAGTHYIRSAYRDAATPNMVTVTLADYRGFDTLGETLVVLTAGIACFLILRRRS
ncbi:MAG TPA: hydrogen gas-evolving membrane-bound hydrogenase subunit E [Methylomirabilota bacterium]|nr:hydrogen gas-evolving membrane-bound hydrogenase subunit E [Methylomirabilota bacterium]